jgi:hypothetical protein
MAILRFPVSPPEPCIVAIFKPTNFKFKILIKNYITKNNTSGFFDKLSISSGIEVELGPSRIKGFFYCVFSFGSHTAISQPNSIFKPILDLL